MAIQSGENRTLPGEIAAVIVIFFGVAGIAFWQFATSFAEQEANSGGPFDNAAMFPRLIAWALVILGAVQIFAAFRAKGANGTEAATSAAEDRYLTLRALGCLVCFVLYLSTVTVVGYIAATIVMLCAMFLILGAGPVMALGVALVATFTIGIVFNTVLNVVLPVGRLGLPTVF